MASKLIISYTLLALFITYSFGTPVKRHTDYGSGNNADPVDNAGEAPMVKENVKKENMGLIEAAEGAIAGAVQQGIVNKLLGNGGSSDSAPQDQPASNVDNGENIDPNMPGPTHESTMKRIMKGAIQGAIAGAAAGVVNNNHNN